MKLWLRVGFGERLRCTIRFLFRSGREEQEADGLSTVNVFYREVAANIVRFSELEAVASALARAGVEYIVLKGAALANTVYPSITFVRTLTIA